jgi:hypothetical protein
MKEFEIKSRFDFSRFRARLWRLQWLFWTFCWNILCCSFIYLIKGILWGFMRCGFILSNGWFQGFEKVGLNWDLFLLIVLMMTLVSSFIFVFSASLLFIRPHSCTSEPNLSQKTFKSYRFSFVDIFLLNNK